MMTFRQQVLKMIYPLFTKLRGLSARDTTVLQNTRAVPPRESIYDLEVSLNTGEVIRISRYRGRQLLLVNTASDCGYTAQYAELQDLHERCPKLAIIGFPSNDFKRQEKGTDEAIAAFCRTNFGVTFPLAAKAAVIRGAEQQPVFRWLTDPAKNGWCTQQPSWNFSKYLVDAEGRLAAYFGPAILPSGPTITPAIDH